MDRRLGGSARDSGTRAGRECQRPRFRRGDRLGLEFAPAHRARRIRQLLEEGGTGMDAAYMERIHMDSLLGSWPVFRALLQGLTSRSGSDPADGPL